MAMMVVQPEPVHLVWRLAAI